MKAEKYSSLKESVTDTIIGLPISWIISYLVLLGSSQMNFESLVLISCMQTVILTIVAIIRKFLVREKFKSMGLR
tara:strand:- start:142 stop:366 length:225 start_codon:yes stop_codon:yes gene_type:complete